ncbi:GNAT family N-acetyltransferase [Hamadaea tsunoensis]|uniref:GNAT family N-acetyltransferase n=1 Tax=Hamadaea tsunoensis TaxID=53368 RepID=UPI00042A0ADB|nr:GNAT family N-acetyltransferase [Hamadaea tsunoensis]
MTASVSAVDQSGPALVAAWHLVESEARAADDPGHPEVAVEGTLAALGAAPVEGRLIRRVATWSGEPAAIGELYLPDRENLGWGFVSVIVRPAYRRRGIGTLLLGDLATAIRAAGRTTAVLSTRTGGDWARSLGAVYAQRIAESELDVTAANPVPGVAPVGYRIEHWADRCPDDLVESFARAKDAMADAPDGGLGYEPHRYTAERVRAVEQGFAAKGHGLWVAAAVHEDSGEVAGLTEIELDPHAPGLAHQEDTAVVPAHRGHGLGLWLKTEMLRRLRTEAPAVRVIRTSTDEGNTPMMAINEALGFRRTGYLEQWTLAV